jgi:hypothetical protein
MYQGYTKEPTIILEAVVSKDLWICHVFFGMLDSHNNINVLQRSRYLQGLLKVNVHKSLIKLMAMIIQWVIIWQMEYIHHGQHS